MGQFIVFTNKTKIVSYFADPRCRLQFHPALMRRASIYPTGLTTMIKDPHEKFHDEWGGTQQDFQDRFLSTLEEGYSETDYDLVTGGDLRTISNNEWLSRDALTSCRAPSLSDTFTSFSGSLCPFGGWYGMDANTYCSPGLPLNYNAIVYSVGVSTVVGLARYSNLVSFGIGIVGTAIGSTFYQLMQSSTSGPLENIGALPIP